jgi:hypothetical protein
VYRLGGVHRKFIEARYVESMPGSPDQTSNEVQPDWIPAFAGDSDGSEILPVDDPFVANRDRLLSYEEWHLARRVAESPRLRKSELLPKFLLYVCELYLLGREREISEQRIGIQVFNRPDNYNPGEDNIVRSYARLLRKRLDAYFENEGAEELHRIHIPRGGYVPTFERCSSRSSSVVATQSPEAAEQEDLHEPPESLREEISPHLADGSIETQTGQLLRKGAWLWGAVGMLAGSLLTFAVLLGWNVLRPNQARGPAHALWSQIFQRDRNTLVIATDSGVGILQNLTRSHASIEDYVNGSYLSAIQAPPGLDGPNFNDLRRQSYTSVVSLDVATALMRLPEFVSDRTQIRFAREISLEDLKNSNVVLIGSKHTNPWVSLYEDKLDFKFEYTPQVDDSYIVDLHAVGVEQKIYRNSSDSSTKRTYGAIAFVPSLDNAGHALIVEGLNMAATQAAADVLLQPSLILPVLRQAKSSDGALRPFELLVETVSVGATAPEVKVIATRIGSQS